MMRRLSGALLIPMVFGGLTRAEETAPTTPLSTVTIHMNSVHPRDVLAEITKQTDVGFQVWPENLYEQQRGPNSGLRTSIDLNVDQQTLWSAVDAFCSAAGFVPQNIGNTPAIAFQESNGRSAFGKRPQSIGPIATVVVDSLERNHTLALDAENPQVQRSCGAHLSAYIDPRVRMMKFQNRPSIERADDDNSQSIAVAQNGQSNSQDAYCKWLVQGVFVPLDYDPQISHKLVALKGSIKITVAADVEKLEFDDLD